MMAAGQAGPDTQCCPVGESAWRPLGSVLGTSAPGAGGPGLPAPYNAGAPSAVAKPTNGLAIASLVLGVMGLVCCVTGLPAVICGHLAQGQIKRSNGAQSGGGLVIAGLILGYLTTAALILYLIGILAGVALPAFGTAQAAARETMCVAQARQVALACRMYASDNDGKFPPRLEDLTPTYLSDEKILLCPLKKDGEGSGYEYFGGKDTDPGEKVLLRSRDRSSRGRRIVARVDQSAESISEPSPASR